MRTLSPEALAALAAGTVIMAMLVRVDLDGQVYNDGATAHAEFASLLELRTLSAAHGLWAPDPAE